MQTAAAPKAEPMPSRRFREITYKCATPDCGNTQTLRYFYDDPPLTVTNCVKCRAGFGKELAFQLEHHVGMFPVKGSEKVTA